MLGHTHGNRSAVTCHLKCDSACASPPPNSSTEPTFAEIARGQLSRRALLIGGGALAATAAAPALMPQLAAATEGRRAPGESKIRGPLAFDPIAPVDAAKDAVTVPPGFEWTTILRWGDPLFHNSPAFDPEQPNAEAQELQFGYNNDYLDILVTDRAGREALLVCNHEYTNRAIMFPPSDNEAQEAEVLRTLMAAHGFSVVELRRRGKGKPWKYVRGGERNNRITAYSLFSLTGPAAGSDLMKTAADPSGKRVYGTLGNCAGGTTPWGTVLSGEENFNGYFKADPLAQGSARYGLTDKASTYGFEKIDPRFDATKPDYANEPNRFAYMGDDERFDYLYKFVAKKKYKKGDSAAARRHNLTLLTEGDLYVARFSGVQKPGNDNLGRGTWVPLTQDGKSAVPGMSVEEVLVFTRLAADKVKATPMDRCEDVEPNPRTGKVYVACTNNSQRGTDGKPAIDPANPRPANKDGHIIEITEHKNQAAATTFDWNLFLVCGNPEDAGTYFGGWDGPVAPISCPDNVAFDSTGNLWISTDGAPSGIGKADGLYRVPVMGRERGHVVQFLAVPNQAETCGPVIHDQDGSVFVAVQHPGEDGSWDDQQSYFPDYVPEGTRPDRGDWRGPRPSVVQVTAK
jgi:secreted PhoX family phosphatase